MAWYPTNIGGNGGGEVVAAALSGQAKQHDTVTVTMPKAGTCHVVIVYPATYGTNANAAYTTFSGVATAWATGPTKLTNENDGADICVEYGTIEVTAAGTLTMYIDWKTNNRTTSQAFYYLIM